MKVWSIAFAALCGLALTGLAHRVEPLRILSSMERSDTPSKTRFQISPTRSEASSSPALFKGEISRIPWLPITAPSRDADALAR
jgi:hypothetical protein